MPWLTDPLTHSMTSPRQGHGLTKLVDTSAGLGLSYLVVGCSQTPISQGDYIILGNGLATSRYKVETIVYYDDPGSLFQAIIYFPKE